MFLSELRRLWLIATWGSQGAVTRERAEMQAHARLALLQEARPAAPAETKHRIQLRWAQAEAQLRRRPVEIL